MHILNDKNQIILFNIKVNKVAWGKRLTQGDTLDIPSREHYRAALPYVRGFGLRIVSDEHDFPLEPTQLPQPEEHYVLTHTKSLYDIHSKEDLYEALQVDVGPVKTSEKKSLLTEDILSNKTKAQLKDLCSQQNLETSGSKDDLIQRVLERQKEDLI